MPRAKRDAKSFTIKMDSKVYERLEQYCEDSGQSKTTAVERAVMAYIDEYENERKIIEKNK